MIKAKQVFFWTSNLKGHGFHGGKATIFYLTSEYYSLSVLSAKLYFLEIGPVHQKLWPFTCMMLKTLNSNFLNWEDTLRLIGSLATAGYGPAFSFMSWWTWQVRFFLEWHLGEFHDVKKHCISYPIKALNFCKSLLFFQNKARIADIL